MTTERPEGLKPVPDDGMTTLKGERRWGIDHTGFGVSDVVRSAKFYDAVLGALGLQRAAQLPEDSGTDAVGFGRGDYPVFWIDRFHAHGTRNHTAFIAASREEVDAFHAAGLRAGGTDNGPPGPRQMYPSSWYVAFVRDLDGNNVEAIFHGD